MRTLSVKHMFVIGVMATAATISGCSSMSATECMATDWRTIGYEDGVVGYSGNRIGKYRKACAEHGLSPDLSQYQLGRDQGLREFCKPVNGFRAGARGNGYNGVCPADLDAGFMAAYESGRQLFTLRSRVNTTANDISSLRNELDRIDKNLVATGARVLDPTITHEQRAQYLIDSKQMAERKGEIKASIPQLETALAAYQLELDEYRATLPYVE